MAERELNWDHRWRCSWCYARYTIQEVLALQMVCLCGKTFHRDKWRLQEYVEGPLGRFWVSTVDLEINHGFSASEQWYETMVLDLNSECTDYQERYETREQAEAGHRETLRMVEQGLIEPQKLSQGGG